MSSIDKTLYADAEEIAAAIGKSPRTVNRMANDENWSSIEANGRGRNKKKWFLIKKLPTEYYQAVVLARLNANLLAAPAKTELPATAGQSVELPAAETTSSDLISSEAAAGHFYDESTTKQRSVEQAVVVLMAFIESFPGTKAKAIRHLNAGYADKTLESPLVLALENSRHKASGKAKTYDALSVSTVDKWQQRFKKTGSYMPKVRQKDWSVTAWHADLVDLLAKNKGGRTYKWMHEQLEEQG